MDQELYGEEENRTFIFRGNIQIRKKKYYGKRTMLLDRMWQIR